MRYARGESIRRGNEIHPYHEILFFLDGGGKMLTEEFERSLEREALCIIPKNTYHRFQIQDENRYTRLVLSFDDTAARGIGAYLTP
jgi:cupin superfamily acireductone dioxygenase involved in methionine salvage